MEHACCAPQLQNIVADASLNNGRPRLSVGTNCLVVYGQEPQFQQVAEHSVSRTFLGAKITCKTGADVECFLRHFPLQAAPNIPFSVRGHASFSGDSLPELGNSAATAVGGVTAALGINDE